MFPLVKYNIYIHFRLPIGSKSNRSAKVPRNLLLITLLFLTSQLKLPRIVNFFKYYKYNWRPYCETSCRIFKIKITYVVFVRISWKSYFNKLVQIILELYPM